MHDKKNSAEIKICTSFSEADVREFYRFLGHPGGTYTEIRAINPQTKERKCFFVENEEEFVDKCRELNERYNVYAGINPRKERRGDTSSIRLATVIPIDIDSRHPKDEAATKKEIESARKEALKVKEWIEEKAKTRVGFTSSGNGFHLLIPVHHEVNEEWSRKSREFYALLREKFENKNCRIDSVGDLPRIIKVSGTKSIKGSNTNERPHRYSYAIELERKGGSQAIIDFIGKLEERREIVKDAEFESAPRKYIRHCFVGAGREERTQGDNFRFALACEYIAAGRSDQEIHEVFSRYYNYDADITQFHLNRIRRHGYRAFKCDTLARYEEFSELCKECKQKRREREEKTSRREVPYYCDDSRLILEVLTTDKQYKFAYLKNGKVMLADSVDLENGITITPICLSYI